VTKRKLVPHTYKLSTVLTLQNFQNSSTKTKFNSYVLGWKVGGSKFSRIAAIDFPVQGLNMIYRLDSNSYSCHNCSTLVYSLYQEYGKNLFFFSWEKICQFKMWRLTLNFPNLYGLVLFFEKRQRSLRKMKMVWVWGKKDNWSASGSFSAISILDSVSLNQQPPS
jgi:hypothetical protein